MSRLGRGSIVSGNDFSGGSAITSGSARSRAAVSRVSRASAVSTRGLTAVLLTAVLTAGLLLGCGRQAGQGQGGGAGGGAAASNNVELKMTEYSFTPKEVRVTAGQPVTLTLNNQGADSHNLVIDAFNVKSQTIPAGQKGQVVFTPNQKGSFKIYCSMPGHEASGMTATLIVQ